MSAPAVEGISARHASRVLASWGVAGFVVLGLPDGMLGTAWPTMRYSFHQPLGNLGLLMIIGMCGNLCTSLTTSRLLRRFGAGAVLVGAGLLAATAMTLLAVAPVWPVALLAMFLGGGSAGLLDTGLNVVVALSGRLRLLNMLHGAYGVGSSIGPLVVTAAILVGSWRLGYLVMIVLDLVLAVGWWRTSGHWPASEQRAGGDVLADTELAEGLTPDAGSAPSMAARPRARLVLALGVVMFFCYTGLEVTTGGWAASFLRGHLHTSPGTTGPAVFAYWVALTLARFGIALPRKPLDPVMLIRVGCAGGIAGSLLLWWSPSTAMVIVALALMGAAFAGVFPAMVSLTPVRLGAQRARDVIGWQIAAANVGGAGLSALTGLVLQHHGLDAFGPCLLAIGLVTTVCNGVIEVVTRTGRGAAASGAATVS